ncbi:MAG TPA: hypothetical protein VJ838_06570 [Gaiellaceae bacterium]|nr:hypothetical protein [Gaiellaceae bacterium]
MARPAAVVLYVIGMAAVVLAVDVLFWERLAASVGIVLVSGAFYFRFLHPT